MTMNNHKPTICNECGQTTTYLIAIDRGTVDIVRQIAMFIGKKGINAVHPRKEMEGSYLTSNQVGNLSRPRLHGLIAKVRGESGNYCLTKKGAEFLNGEIVPKIAIVQKANRNEERRTIGYLDGEENTCVIGDFNKGEYWQGIGYVIKEGEVIVGLSTE